MLPGSRTAPRTTAPFSTRAPRPTTLDSTLPATVAPGAITLETTSALEQIRPDARLAWAWVRIGHAGSSRSIGGSSQTSS